MQKVLKPILKWSAIVVAVTLLIYGISYAVSLKSIEFKTEDLENAFSSALPLKANTAQEKYSFKKGLFKGTYTVSITDTAPYEERYFEKLSNGNYIQASPWYYSTNGGREFPASYHATVIYSDGTRCAWITLQCNFPLLSGYTDFLAEVAQSISQT